jgi:hypothetical protein
MGELSPQPEQQAPSRLRRVRNALKELLFEGPATMYEKNYARSQAEPLTNFQVALFEMQLEGDNLFGEMLDRADPSVVEPYETQTPPAQ